MKVTCVRWKDASYQDGLCYLYELEPQVIIETSGHFIREDEETISLCLDFHPKEQSFRHIAHIPKKMIVARYDVEVDLDEPQGQEEQAQG